ATDSEGNVFVDGSDFTSDTGPSTIYKITPGGTVSMVASIPGGFWGLGFDSAGNIYAAAGGDAATYSYAAIYKYTSAGAPYEPTPTGVPGVFADYTRFTSPQSPVGLAFDSSGNLFVSTTDVVTYSGNGGILEFYPDGTESTFATGLTKNPRGLAFDSGGNLFVAEVSPSGAGNTGDILEFTYGGTGSVGSIV